MASALFHRIFSHLLPQGAAWRLTPEKALGKWWLGLSGAPAAARDFVDQVFDEAFPTSTSYVTRWAAQFGLPDTHDETTQRLQLAAAWGAQGGQSPAYLQQVVQAAGFDLYVHEWWVPGSGSPYVPRDPRNYTKQPQVGSVQCGMKYAQCTASQTLAPDPLPGDVNTVSDLYPQCNRFLANEPGYLVNRNLTDVAPPPVPDDAAAWPYFVYLGGPTFGSPANVPNERRDELERLLLKICPAHLWIVTLVDFGQWRVGDTWAIGTPGLTIGAPPP